MKRSIIVTWTQEGFHCWPEAPTNRSYLADQHRHQFHYRAGVEVEHNDREVEFHDMLDELRACTQAVGTQLGRVSCEDLAQIVLTAIEAAWPGRNRWCEVFEDGEVGARLEMSY